MKKFMKGTLSILLVAILMIGTVSSAIAATIDKTPVKDDASDLGATKKEVKNNVNSFGEEFTSGASATNGLNDSAHRRRYQTFTMPYTATVSSVVIIARSNSANPLSTFSAYIYSTSDNMPVNNPLWSSKSISDTTTTNHEITFTSTSSVELTEGKQYAIVIKADTDLSGTKYLFYWATNAKEKYDGYYFVPYPPVDGFDGEYFGIGTETEWATPTLCEGYPFAFKLNHDEKVSLPSTDLQVNMHYYDNDVNSGGTPKKVTYTQNYTQAYETRTLTDAEYYVPVEDNSTSCRTMPEYLNYIAAELDSTKLHSSIYDDYTFKTSQAEYEAMMKTTVNPHSLYEGGTKDYNNMYYYGKYYESSTTTNANGYIYHTNAYGVPQYGADAKDASGKVVQSYPVFDSQKWITYYTKNSSGGYDEITEAKALEEWLKVDKIDIWLYNVPKSYEVKVYNSNFTKNGSKYVANTATQTINATYNQRLGGRNTPYLPVPKSSTTLTSALASLGINYNTAMKNRYKVMYGADVTNNTLLTYLKAGTLLDPNCFYEVDTTVNSGDTLVTKLGQNTLETVCKAYDMTWTGSAEQKALLLKIYQSGRLIKAEYSTFDIRGTLPTDMTYPAAPEVSSIDQYFRTKLGMTQVTKDFVQDLYKANNVSTQEQEQTVLLPNLKAGELVMPNSEAPDNHGDMRNAYLSAYNKLAYTGTTATANATAKSGNTSLVFSYWSGDAQGKTVLSTNRNYNFRVTEAMSLYAVYEAGSSTVSKGVTMTKANTQVYDSNGTSRTRMNTIINPYGFYDNDSRITHTSAIYVVAKTNTALDKTTNVATVKTQLENYFKNLSELKSGSVTASNCGLGSLSINGVNYYIYVDPKLTNKNRMSFGLDFTTTTLSNKTLYAFGAVRYNDSGNAEWLVSDNCIKYAFGANGAIS